MMSSPRPAPYPQSPPNRLTRLRLYRCSYVLMLATAPVRDIVVDVDYSENGATRGRRSRTSKRQTLRAIRCFAGLAKTLSSKQPRAATLNRGSPSSAISAMLLTAKSDFWRSLMGRHKDRVIEYEFEGPFEAGGLIQGSRFSGGRAQPSSRSGRVHDATCPISLKTQPISRSR